MRDDSNCEREVFSHEATSYVPKIANEDIFRKLIEDELRAGRLTPSRRRRIVRYAAHLHLSAVQIGQMIESAHRKALNSEDESLRHHALKLIPADEGIIPTPWKIAGVIVFALIVDLLLVSWIGF